MKLALGLLALLAIGCTKKTDQPATNTPVNQVACTVEKAVVSLVASAVTTQLECKNLDAVKAKLGEEVAKTNLCKDVETNKASEVTVKGSSIGQLVCPSVVQTLMDGALKQIPADWECTGGQPAAKLQSYLLEQCKKAI